MATPPRLISKSDHNLELLQVELAIAVLIGLSVNGEGFSRTKQSFFGGKSVLGVELNL